MLFTSAGKAMRFKESDVRAMGRTACGVRGVKLGKDQAVISLIIGDDGDVMTVTENGYGKRTPIDQFPVKGRGGMGVISIKTSERNGEQVGAVLVDENDEVTNDISEGLEYIASNPNITNVLLTGGDPLLMSTRRLVEIVESPSLFLQQY